ncbi:hypothetical protein [Methylosinus sp. Ce-a6]|uniref:hypothetical protein n=1 Tax=Methylosinus sp. Ce-a6 TaxID=2172005 RepID=UPI00278BAE88|nr:hypothetical protein [Methylosinus sp. Ce-a6]
MTVRFLVAAIFASIGSGSQAQAHGGVGIEGQREMKAGSDQMSFMGYQRRRAGRAARHESGNPHSA